MNPDYFSELSKALHEHQQAVPCMVIDLDRLDANIRAITQSIDGKKNLRIVSKSLPSPQLIDYIMQATGATGIMDFHAPFLLQLTGRYGARYDVLMGKPLPAVAVKNFLLQCRQRQLPVQQIQWLADTLARLKQYQEIAQQLDTRLRINLELNIGLNRGGFESPEALAAAMNFIREHPDHLLFSGCMGYEPHVVKVPRLLGTPESHFQKTQAAYAEFLKILHRYLQPEDLDKHTLNGGGSPTFRLHLQEASAANEVSVGSAFLKPTDFDIAYLRDLMPACFIATPVLKKQEGLKIPALPKIAKKVAFKNFSYFMYGGKWMADFIYPPDGSTNALYGLSTNQCLFTSNLELNVDDFAFLRPHQSEFVLLQFGKLLTYRKGKIESEWDILSN